MKPMMIVPKGLIEAADKELLIANGVVVVEAEDPSKVRFVDPIPAVSSRTQIEHAAIQLSRKILNGQAFNPNAHTSTGDFLSTASKLYISLLLEGTPLSANKTQEELENEAYGFAKIDEQRKIAREDARAERERQKKLAEDALSAQKLKREGLGR